MEDGTKVIRFDPDRAPIRIREAKWCKHPRIIVCEKSRSLECDACGAAIDPFDFMLRWAKGDRCLEARKRQLEDEVKRISGSLEELKREEKNLKARLRRLKS